MFILSLFLDHNGVFGVPLRESLHYASVQISTANANGELYVWGYIPVVVAKWCDPELLYYTTHANCIYKRPVFERKWFVLLLMSI